MTETIDKAKPSNPSLPKHWQLKKLGEVCEMYQPKTISTKQLIENGKYLVYGANGIIGKYNDFNHSESELLVTCRGASCGSVNISEPYSWINGNAMVVRPKDENQINRRFLTYFFKVKGIINSAISGSAQPQITRTTLIPINFPIPPLPEQQAIVAKIEELLSELENGKQQLLTAQQLLKVYRQSLLKWAFEGKLTNKSVQDGELPKDWKTVELKNLVEKISDGPFGSNLKSIDYVDSGVRVIRLENIGEMEFRDEYKTFVTPEKYETIKRHTVGKGDIIFSSFISDSIRSVILPDFIEKAINKADCFLVRADETKMRKKYLAYYFSTKAMQSQLVNKIHGATRPRINTTQLKASLIPFAPIDEQERIVSELESKLTVCDKIEETISQSLQQAETLKQSILKKAFEGRML